MHKLSVDTNADRCTTLIWCSHTDQRRRRRCLAPKRLSSGTGCCSQLLPSEHRCVGSFKVLLSCYWAFFWLHDCYFSGWGSPVNGYWFQIHHSHDRQRLRSDPRGRDVRRNPDALLQVDKQGTHPKEHVCFDKKKKKKVQEFSFIPAHLGFFSYSGKSSDWPLHAEGRIGTCTTHTCSQRLLVVEKAKPLIFTRKKENCFPKVEYTWNWNDRRTKASLRHWKRENWNIFENIWKKSNTLQWSAFLEGTIICFPVGYRNLGRGFPRQIRKEALKHFHEVLLLHLEEINFFLCEKCDVVIHTMNQSDYGFSDFLIWRWPSKKMKKRKKEYN